jgi:hypothetical protein
MHGLNPGVVHLRVLDNVLGGGSIAAPDEEVPEGWIVTGYPWEQITEPAHKAFVGAYRARINGTPRLGSFLGYVSVSLRPKGVVARLVPWAAGW